jgi:hypothetical protein
LLPAATLLATTMLGTKVVKRLWCGARVMASAAIWILFAVVLLFPTAATLGVALWARRWSRSGAPRSAVRVAYGLAAFASLAIVGGLGLGLFHVASSVAGEAAEPSAKARHLAEGISEVMKSGGVGLLATAVAAGWILLSTWRTPPLDPKP